MLIRYANNICYRKLVMIMRLKECLCTWATLTNFWKVVSSASWAGASWAWAGVGIEVEREDWCDNCHIISHKPKSFLLENHRVQYRYGMETAKSSIRSLNSSLGIFFALNIGGPPSLRSVPNFSGSAHTVTVVHLLRSPYLCKGFLYKLVKNDPKQQLIWKTNG